MSVNPSKKCGELTVFSWPENHMPMVRHQTVRQQSNWKALHRRNHDSFKRDIILGFGKQLVSSVRSIQGMINQLTRSYARSPRHCGTLYQSHQFRQEKVCVPFFRFSIRAVCSRMPCHVVVQSKRREKKRKKVRVPFFHPLREL